MKTLSELFSSFPELHVNEDIILRKFSLKDAKDYFEFYSVNEVNKFVPDTMIPKTLEEAEIEVGHILNSFETKQTFYWAIAEKKTGKLIGGCGFHDWNRYNARIEIAYDLHPNYWRRGIMYACMREIIKFAFLEMGVIRIQATTVKENDASNNLLLKFGFKYEGILRKYKFFKEQMVDIMMFSYTSDDFKRDILLGTKFK